MAAEKLGLKIDYDSNAITLCEVRSSGGKLKLV